MKKYRMKLTSVTQQGEPLYKIQRRFMFVFWLNIPMAEKAEGMPWSNAFSAIERLERD